MKWGVRATIAALTALALSSCGGEGDDSRDADEFREPAGVQSSRLEHAAAGLYPSSAGVAFSAAHVMVREHPLADFDRAICACLNHDSSRFVPEHGRQRRQGPTSAP